MPIKNYFGHITYISHVLLLYLFKQTHPSDSFKLVAGCGYEPATVPRTSDRWTYPLHFP